MNEQNWWTSIQKAAGAPVTGQGDLDTARAVVDKWFPNASSAGKTQGELWGLIRRGIGMRAGTRAGSVTAGRIYETLVKEGKQSDWQRIQEAANVTPVDGIPGKLTAQGILSAWMPKARPAATTRDVWRQIQRETGVAPDGIPGNNTAAAILAKWIDPSRCDEGETAVDRRTTGNEGAFNDLYPGDLVDARVHRLCVETISVFESGKKTGGYSTISIYNDGPGGAKQITYGRCQTTESGNLKELLTRYVNAGTGTQAALVIENRLPGIGRRPYLVDDRDLIQALRDAGREQSMQDIQDGFFDDVYFDPAYKWFHDNGFEFPLSLLVIFDSFIHSGSILSFLRNRFPQGTPARGGDEQAWIGAYVRVRRQWLAGHTNPVLRQTVYRMRCFEDAMNKGNWNLDQPVIANGVKIS